MTRLELMRLEKDLRDLAQKWRDGEEAILGEDGRWCAACEISPVVRHGGDCARELVAVVERVLGKKSVVVGRDVK